MANHYRSPKVYAIIFGVIAFIGLLMIVCFLSEAVKFVGAPFLFLPEKMGLIEVVSREEVLKIEMSSGSTVLNFTRSGKFVVYTKDYDLLIISDSLRDVNANIENIENIHSWLNVQSVDRDETIPVRNINRGLMPFDSPLAQGRPVLNFEINTPGRYELKYSTRQALIYVLPDYTTGKEGIIYLIYVVEFLLLLIPVWMFYSGFSQRRKEKTQEIQNLKQIRGEDFWKSEIEKKKEKENDSRQSPRRFR